MQDFRNWRCEDVDDEDAQCDAGRLDTRLRGQTTAKFRDVTEKTSHQEDVC